MLSFGVGCWAFEPVNIRTRDSEEANEAALDLAADSAKFGLAIRQALESIPSVTNVAVSPDFDVDLVNSEPSADDDGSGISIRTGTFVPTPILGSINFDVHVPVAAQVSAVPRFGHLDIGENFRISVRFSFHGMPVAFIFCLDDGVDRPSNAVMFLREFLRSELSARKAPVQLRILGPSPWWADFYALSETEYLAEVDPTYTSLGNTVDPIWVKRRLGYDDVYCVWRDGEFPDDGKAANAFLALFLPEMSLRYSLVANRNIRLTTSVHMAARLDELVSIYEAEGARAALARMTKGGRLTRRLSLQLIRHQASTARNREADYQTVRDFYSTGASDVFRSVLEAEVSDRFESEETGARDVVALLETRRAADLNGVVLIASALVGGGIGSAVATLLAR